MYLDNKYYMVKFDLSKGKEKVVGEGSCLLHDHYLAVKRWHPSFNSIEICFSQTMVLSVFQV